MNINLLKNNKINLDVYGIDVLLKTTLYFLQKNNPLEENKFKKLNKLKTEIEKLDLNKEEDIKKRNNFENQINILFKEISEENSLLSGIGNIQNILEKAKYDASKCIFFSIYFSLLTSDKKKCMNIISLFKKIEYCYKIFTNEISIVPIILSNKNEIIFKGFEILEHINENDKEKVKLIEEKKKQLLEIEKCEKLKIEGFNLKINEKTYDITKYTSKKYTYEYFLFKFGLILSAISNNYITSFGSIITDYFENYIKRQYCIDYVLIQKKIYSNIFDNIKEMSYKNDWHKFHFQII